jgi:hypothetical protein
VKLVLACSHPEADADRAARKIADVASRIRDAVAHTPGATVTIMSAPGAHHEALAMQAAELFSADVEVRHDLAAFRWLSSDRPTPCFLGPVAETRLVFAVVEPAAALPVLSAFARHVRAPAQEADLAAAASLESGTVLAMCGSSSRLAVLS